MRFLGLVPKSRETGRPAAWPSRSYTAISTPPRLSSNRNSHGERPTSRLQTASARGTLPRESSTLFSKSPTPSKPFVGVELHQRRVVVVTEDTLLPIRRREHVMNPLVHRHPDRGDFVAGDALRRSGRRSRRQGLSQRRPDGSPSADGGHRPQRVAPSEPSHGLKRMTALCRTVNQRDDRSLKSPASSGNHAEHPPAPSVTKHGSRDTKHRSDENYAF